MIILIFGCQIMMGINKIWNCNAMKRGGAVRECSHHDGARSA